MNPEEKEKIQQEISKQIEETKKKIEILKEQSKPVAPDNAIGRITRMDAIQSKSLAEANLLKANTTLIRLREAQENYEQPGFGQCRICKKNIPIARILIVPECTLCVPCASRK